MEHTIHITPLRDAPSLGSLRQHLWAAMVLEQATLPAYLTALYSIKDGTNVEAASLIQSVAMEEMLHMAQVANLINAIGGTPQVDIAGFVPAFPTYLPNSDHAFLVYVQKFSRQALETFMKIECPAPLDAVAQYDAYASIGQLYAAIEAGLAALAEEQSIFIGDPARQLPSRHYYGGNGNMVEVHDLESAKAAMEEIIDQGEGFLHGIYEEGRSVRDDDWVPAGNEVTKQVAHYFRFEEILVGQRYTTDDKTGAPTGDVMDVDWSAVHDLKPIRRTADYDPDRDRARWAHSRDFDLTYTHLLVKLHVAFNHDPSEFLKAVGTMYELKYKAQALMRMPASDDPHDTLTMGPAWEWVPPPDPSHLDDPKREARKEWLRGEMADLRRYFDDPAG